MLVVKAFNELVPEVWVCVDSDLIAVKESLFLVNLLFCDKS